MFVFTQDVGTSVKKKPASESVWKRIGRRAKRNAAGVWKWIKDLFSPRQRRLLAQQQQVVERIKARIAGLPVMTIKLGTDPGAELIRKIHDSGGMINDKGKELLSTFVVAPTTTEIRVKLVGKDDLGLPEEATGLEVFQMGFSIDLKRCSPETGPQLWLQHDQPDGESVVIVMDPISIPIVQGYPWVFNVAKINGVRHLRGFAAGVRDRWPKGTLYAFRCE